MEKRKHRAKVKSSVRPLKKKRNAKAPFRMSRYDFDDGSIAYEIWDERPDTFHRLCSTYEQDEYYGTARRDAKMIVDALNLIHKGGKK